MRNLLLLGALCCLFTNAETAKQGPKTSAPAAAQKPKDPVVIYLEGRSIKLSEIMPYLVNLVGGNFNGLSKEQLMNAIDMARKMYVMQIRLEREADKKHYDADAKFKAQFEKAKKSTAIGIYMQELGKTFSESQIKAAYSKYAANNTLSDFSFKLIVVQDEKVANLIKESLNNGVDFGKLAKEKSLHGSADRENNPGLIDFIREDYIARAFGPDFVRDLRAMRSNEVRIMKLPDGKFSIIKFAGKRKSSPLALNEVKPRLLMDLTNAKLIEETDKFLESGAKSGTIAFYSLDGKKETVSKLTPAPAAQKVAKK